MKKYNESSKLVNKSRSELLETLTKAENDVRNGNTSSIKSTFKNLRKEIMEI